jgi:hypothetical protein
MTLAGAPPVDSFAQPGRYRPGQDRVVFGDQDPHRLSLSLHSL